MPPSELDAHLAEFERAVLLSFEAEPSSLRSAATASLEQLKQSGHGWSFCMQAFAACSDDRARFWCVQAVVDVVKSRYSSLNDEEKQTLRGMLLAWVQSKNEGQADEPVYIKNKVAQLIVAVMAHDYPQHWPQVFPQLLGMLWNGAFCIDMFLRVMHAIQEDIVSSEGSGYNPEVATRVKDGMRENCLPQVADAWYSILQYYYSSAPSLCAMCLNTLSHFISWIDITLVANARFMGLLVPFMHNAALHDGACACLTEIVIKRMDASLKMEHLARLQMINLLSDAASSGVTLSEKFSALASALALEILDCWDRLSSRTPASPELASQAAEGVVRVMPLVLMCLEWSDLEAAQGTLGFLHSYVGRLRKLAASPKELEAHEPHLRRLLLALANKSLYPEEYNFDEEDEEDEKAFLDFRREISTLFKGVARVHLGLAQDFVRNTLQSTLAPSEGVPWRHLEVAMWLLYTLGEGLPDAAIREKDGFFRDMMVKLLQSSASSYPQQECPPPCPTPTPWLPTAPLARTLHFLLHAVQLLYLDTVVRFYRFFLVHTDYLPSVLWSFLDHRGLSNTNATVRARASYLLLRFVKQTIKSANASFVDVATHLIDLLQQQPPPLDELSAPPSPSSSSTGAPHAAPSREGPALSASEQLCLFETCGLLLGAGLAPADLVAEMAASLLAPPVRNLSRLCSLAAAPPPVADERAAAAAQQIAAVAVLSKGFTALGEEQRPLRDSFSRATQLALAALGPYGDSRELRAKALMLLHRMVETLDQRVVELFAPAVPQLLSSAEPREVEELVTLLNQLVLKFRGKIYTPLSRIVAPLSAALFAHLAALDVAIANSSSAAVAVSGPQSDEVRERQGLLRSFYSFVHSLVHSELTAVLSAPEFSIHMAPSMQALARGSIEGPDLQIQRQCFVTMQRLVEQWGGSDAGSFPGFNSYILQEMLPLCFQAPAQAHFDLKDAASHQLLEAIASFQISMLTKLGSEFMSYMCEVQLPSLGAPAELVNEYARILAERDVYRLRDYLRQQLAAGRSL
ncbi:hypothetical protein AB1Y20_015568 [Prymnesium parvum]|uniref:Exportin-T n=1 Tax=Prymnesium parvum TaxID=97485 RepID=A0AB34K193_PRYPA